MSKSRDCEQLRAERDHWRGRAHALAEQNRALQDEIERLQIYSAFFQGGMATMDQSIQQLQAERNYYFDQLQLTEQALSNYYNATSQQARSVHESAQEIWERPPLETLQASVLGWAMQIIYLKAVQDVEQRFQAGAGERSLALHEQPIINDPGMAILAAYRDGVITGVSLVTEYAAQYAHGMSNKPELICSIILEELAHKNEAPIEWLARLPQTWIDEHLKPGLELTTLQIGLVKAHESERGGQTLAQAATALSVSERNLKRYRSWLKTVEETGQQFRA